jgi:hypothetical protein
MQARGEGAQAPAARSAEWRQVPLRMPRLRIDLRRDDRDAIADWAMITEVRIALQYV